MHIAEVVFERIDLQDSAEAPAAILDLLGFLRMNGEIVGREFPLVESERAFHTFVMLPLPTSLAPRHANAYVQHGYAQLARLAVSSPIVRVLGADPTSAEPCRCQASHCFILHTSYILVESPLRCGTCFGPLPLYHVPPTVDEEYQDVVSWQSDFQACDRLYMNSATGEQFALHELAHPTSSLAHRGRTICHMIEAATRVPTFYTLFVPEQPRGTECGMSELWQGVAARRTTA